jgi:hypothetical protein
MAPRNITSPAVAWAFTLIRSSTNSRASVRAYGPPLLGNPVGLSSDLNLLFVPHVSFPLCALAVCCFALLQASFADRERDLLRQLNAARQQRSAAEARTRATAAGHSPAQWQVRSYFIHLCRLDICDIGLSYQSV